MLKSWCRVLVLHEKLQTAFPLIFCRLRWNPAVSLHVGLSDQNEDLQDCWFLTAMISFADNTRRSDDEHQQEAASTDRHEKALSHSCLEKRESLSMIRKTYESVFKLSTAPETPEIF